jgi:hypothetical protein
VCMKAPKMKTPKPPAPPPAPAADEKPQTPVIDEGFGEGDQISAKRRGRSSLTIPLGGLNIPR